MSRIAAASGIASIVVTFGGFGIHGGLPSDATAASVQKYVSGVNASTTGLGNYLELLGYLLILVFAAYLYALARASSRDRLHWLNVLGLAAAVTYVAVSGAAIAGQQALVEWSRTGADAKTALGFYILDSDAFTLSFEIVALFAIALGIVLLATGSALRVIGGAAILVGLVLFVTGMVGTMSIQSSIAQIGLLLFELWVAAVSIYLLIRPAVISRST